MFFMSNLVLGLFCLQFVLSPVHQIYSSAVVRFSLPLCSALQQPHSFVLMLQLIDGRSCMAKVYTRGMSPPVEACEGSCTSVPVSSGLIPSAITSTPCLLDTCIMQLLPVGVCLMFIRVSDLAACTHAHMQGWQSAS